MSIDYATNRAFADSYAEEIRSVIQQNIGTIATVQTAANIKDCKAGADYTVRCQTGGDVLVRVRRCDIKYRDFTIRAYANGQRTELEKLRDGYGDWYLYAWTGDSGRIEDWVLVDVERMRRSQLLDKDRRVIPNKDGTTAFVAITKKELRAADCLAKERHPPPMPSANCGYGCHSWQDETIGKRKRKACSKCGALFGYYDKIDSPAFPNEWIHG